MSMASGVTDHAREKIPAVVHANGTSRLQIVSRADIAFIPALLTAFGERTGVPVLIKARGFQDSRAPTRGNPAADAAHDACPQPGSQFTWPRSAPEYDA
jgi:hypothetical protein